MLTPPSAWPGKQTTKGRMRTVIKLGGAHREALTDERKQKRAYISRLKTIFHMEPLDLNLGDQLRESIASSVEECIAYTSEDAPSTLDSGDFEVQSSVVSELKPCGPKLNVVKLKISRPWSAQPTPWRAATPSASSQNSMDAAPVTKFNEETRHRGPDAASDAKFNERNIPKPVRQLSVSAAPRCKRGYASKPARPISAAVGGESRGYHAQIPLQLERPASLGEAERDRGKAGLPPLPPRPVYEVSARARNQSTELPSQIKQPVYSATAGDSLPAQQIRKPPAVFSEMPPGQPNSISSGNTSDGGTPRSDVLPSATGFVLPSGESSADPQRSARPTHAGITIPPEPTGIPACALVKQDCAPHSAAGRPNVPPPSVRQGSSTLERGGSIPPSRASHVPRPSTEMVHPTSEPEQAPPMQELCFQSKRPYSAKSTAGYSSRTRSTCAPSSTSKAVSSQVSVASSSSSGFRKQTTRTRENTPAECKTRATKRTPRKNAPVLRAVVERKSAQTRTHNAPCEVSKLRPTESRSRAEVDLGDTFRALRQEEDALQRSLLRLDFLEMNLAKGGEMGKEMSLAQFAQQSSLGQAFLTSGKTVNEKALMKSLQRLDRMLQCC